MHHKKIDTDKKTPSKLRINEMVFISLDYSPLKTLNCSGNSTHGVVSVAFDSTYLLASGSGDKTVKLWNKHKGDLVRTLNGHGGSVWSVAFASNNILASGSDSYDKKIRIWDTNSGNMLRTPSGHGNLIWQVAIDSNDLLASSSWDRTIKIWGA